MKAPMEEILATVLPRPADTGAHHSEAVTPNIFCAPQILLCTEIFVLNI